jgi:hypothetical protein
MDKLCCFTGYSFLDWWTLVHFCFWIFIGSTLWAFKLKKSTAVSVCFGVSLAWEIFERQAEKLWPNRWQDPESWFNAWLSDPLTAITGTLLIWWLLDHRKRKADL